MGHNEGNSKRQVHSTTLKQNKQKTKQANKQKTQKDLILAT